MRGRTCRPSRHFPIKVNVLLLSLLTLGGVLATPQQHVISVIAYQRPKYFSRMLASLEECIGIEKYKVLFFLEPSDSGVIELARAFDATESTVHVNTERLGFYRNIRQGVETGLQHSDFVILVEEDMLMAADTLVWFEYARIKYANDAEVFTVSGYGDNCHQLGQTVPESFFFRTSRRQHFTPWVWGIWEDRFKEIKDTYIGWDMQMNFHAPPPAEYGNIRMGKPGLRGERYEVFPVFSRVNNIGVEGGAHQNAVKTESMEKQYIQHWAGSQNQACDASGVGGSCGDFKEIADVSEVCASVHFGSDTLSSMCTSKEDKQAMRAWHAQIDASLAEGKKELGLGNIEGAIVAYERVRSIAPSSNEYMFPLAIAYANTPGKAEEAKALLVAFLGINPASTNARFTLANLYAQSRELDEALKEYKAVVTQDPTHGEAHSNLAVAYHQQGLGEPATLHYERALELGVESARANYQMLQQQLQSEQGGQGV